MSETLLIIGIIVTSIALIAMTVFSISNFILKRIYKEEEKTKTKEEKQKEKTIKRMIKTFKKFIKVINRRLVNNLLAFYGFTGITLAGGIALTTVGAVQTVQKNAAVISSSEESSSISSVESSESSESSYVSSISSISSESSSESSSSSGSLPSNFYTIRYHHGTTVLVTEEVTKGDHASDINAPYEIGYSFNGWYYDTAFQNPFSTIDEITSDLDIYGDYQEQYWTVNYMDDDSNIVITNEIRDGTYAQNHHYVNPVSSYVYYWYKEEGLYTTENLFDFKNTPIQGDTIIYGSTNTPE